MGFTTGFTGGVTLTLGLAYLTILSHQRNRQAQALYLRSQSQLLNSLIDPAPLYPPTRTEIVRQSHGSLTESAKERWNAEVENAVRWLQNTDWNGAREGMEGAIARMIGLGLQRSQEGIEEAEEKTGSILGETLDRTKATANRNVKEAASGVDRVSEVATEKFKGTFAGTREDLKQLPGKANDIASASKTATTGAVAEIKERADSATQPTQDALRQGVDKVQGAANKAHVQVSSRSVGTVDAARSVVRDAVGKGTEKGKEVIDKAQEAVDSVTSKIELVAEGSGVTAEVSPVEKALRERYKKNHEQDKTVKEMLEERYRPIDQRDNTILRGV